ncbi:hypothetical protein [Rubrivirga sp. IMCC45206]|uniref:hypothetical protein n=1 Tax=Rubrivirga sp. IMCC45206 TaxID=3391614 RepID=UPI00399034BD
MILTTHTLYDILRGRRVQLALRIGSAGLAVTDVTLNGALVVEGHEGHLTLDLGPADDLDASRVKVYTSVRGPKSTVPNRVDYRLTGGQRHWTATLREDPPDEELDWFYANIDLLLS